MVHGGIVRQVYRLPLRVVVFRGLRPLDGLADELPSEVDVDFLARLRRHYGGQRNQQ